MKTDLPQYIAANLPIELACMTVPIIAIIAHPIRVTLRPNLSANQLAAKAPAKHPACKVETIFASRLALPTLSRWERPNTLTKLVRFMVLRFMYQY